MGLSWKLEVDWNGDSSLESDEAGNLQEITVTRGRQAWVKTDGSGFEPMQTGEAICVLRNTNARYDPFGTASPIYPNVLPGREAKLTALDGTVPHGVLRGRLKDVVPSGDGPQAIARLIIDDGWSWLDQSVSCALGTAIVSGTAISTILTAANWPTSWGQALDAGDDTIPYWWVDSENAADAIDSIANSELGEFIVNKDGQAVFKSRTSQIGGSAEFTLGESDIAYDGLMLPQPWHSIRNIVHVVVHPRVPLATAVLWTLQNKPAIASGVTAKYIAKFTANNRDVVATNVLTPVATTDFTANSAADDSGVDMTDSITPGKTAYGKTAEVTMLNSGHLETSATIQPAAAAGQDTNLSKNNPTYNFGVNSVMYVGGFTGLANTPYRGLIRFDPSSIPSDATIVSAVLTLRQNGQAGTATRVVKLYRALTQWFEGVESAGAPGAGVDGSTWNQRNANGPLTWGAAGGQAGTDYNAIASDSATCPDSSGADVTWSNLATDVQAWVNGSVLNYGWWLIADDENTASSWKSFATSDDAGAYPKPKLLVTYTRDGITTYSTLLHVRGDPLDEPDTTVIESDNSAGSLYGPRTLEIDEPWQQTVAVAQALADYLAGTALPDPLAYPRVQLKGDDLALSFSHDLLSKLTLNVPSKGISALYRIGGISQHWRAQVSDKVETIWYLESIA